MCKGSKHTVVTTVAPGSPGIPAHSGFTVYFVLSSVIGFLVTVAGVMRSIITHLTPAPRRQDHTTSPSAKQMLSSAAPLASTASRPAFVTIAIRPFEWDETMEIRI